MEKHMRGWRHIKWQNSILHHVSDCLDACFLVSRSIHDKMVEIMHSIILTLTIKSWNHCAPGAFEYGDIKWCSPDDIGNFFFHAHVIKQLYKTPVISQAKRQGSFDLKHSEEHYSTFCPIIILSFLLFNVVLTNNKHGMLKTIPDLYRTEHFIQL